MTYKKFYGQWAGNERGTPADLDKCCASVHQNFRLHQCSNKRGHGPEGAYCKTHDPAAVQKRKDASDYKYKLGLQQKFMRQYGREIAIIKAIAEGHNDPRTLCQEWLDDRKELMELPKSPLAPPPPPPAAKK